MKKQLLLCAYVAVSSLLASDFENNQQPGKSAPTIIDDVPIEMLANIVRNVVPNIEDLAKLSQVSKNFHSVVMNTRICDLREFAGIFLDKAITIGDFIANSDAIDETKEAFLDSLNVANPDHKSNLIEILQKCPAASPMKALSMLPTFVENASTLLSFDKHSKHKNNPSLEFIIAAQQIYQGYDDSDLLIKYFAKVPDNRYESFIGAAKKLPSYKDYRSLTIKTLSEVPADSYFNFVQLVETFDSSTNTLSSINLMRCFAQIPVDGYERFVNLVNEICKDMSPYDKEASAVIISKLPDRHYEAFLNQLNLADKVNTFVISDIIRRLPKQ